jgi:hypothetical protein
LPFKCNLRRYAAEDVRKLIGKALSKLPDNTAGLL